MKVEFGVIDHVDRQDEPIGKTYESRLKLLELYDKAGFTTFHITEHHCTPLGLAPSPMIFLAAASRITEQIRFAPLVLIATLYNPLRLAAEICMLDHLTKGRFEIGTGRGVSGVELGFFNVSEQDAPAMYGEAMEVVMAALTRDVVDFHGTFFDFTNVPIELKPYQLPHPPIWYATNSAESAAKAARQIYEHRDAARRRRSRQSNPKLQRLMECGARWRRKKNAPSWYHALCVRGRR